MGTRVLLAFFFSSFKFNASQVIMIYWHSSTILLPSIRQQGPLAIQSSFFLFQPTKADPDIYNVEWDKSKRHWRFGGDYPAIWIWNPLSLIHCCVGSDAGVVVGGEGDVYHRPGQRPTDDLPSLHLSVYSSHPAREQSILSGRICINIDPRGERARAKITRLSRAFHCSTHIP